LEKTQTKKHIIFNPFNNNNNSPNKKPDDQDDKDKKKNKDAKAPGKPTEKDGFKTPKGKVGNGGKIEKHHRTGQYGWKDAKGNLWVPTGKGPLAHGGALTGM